MPYRLRKHANKTDRRETATSIQDGAAAGNAHANSNLASRLSEVMSALSTSRVARTLVLLAAAICVVIMANAYGQIRLVAWNKPFLDSFSRRDLRDYLFQI